jgi:hypothetical protein
MVSRVFLPTDVFDWDPCGCHEFFLGKMVAVLLGARLADMVGAAPAADTAADTPAVGGEAFLVVGGPAVGGEAFLVVGGPAAAGEAFLVGEHHVVAEGSAVAGGPAVAEGPVVEALVGAAFLAVVVASFVVVEDPVEHHVVVGVPTMMALCCYQYFELAL